MEFRRYLKTQILQRSQEPRRHLQVLLGPRQVGKTTLAKDLFDNFNGPKLFLSADDPELNGSQNLNELWHNISQQVKEQKKRSK